MPWSDSRCVVETGYQQIDLDLLSALRLFEEEIAPSLNEVLRTEAFTERADYLDVPNRGISVEGRPGGGLRCRVDLEEETHHVATHDPVIVIGGDRCGDGLLAEVTQRVRVTDRMDSDAMSSVRPELRVVAHRGPPMRRAATWAAASSLSGSVLVSKSQ